MDQVIRANRLQFLIGKERESVAGFLAMIAQLLGTIGTDRDGANSSLMELVQFVLNAPQLGVTGWSPIASIENEQHALGWAVIDWLS